MPKDVMPAGLPDTLPDWDPDVDDVLVCRAVRQETHDVKTFVFSGRRPCQFRFRPGQFMTFDVPVGSAIVNRSYTISSSAARPYRISITTKRVPGGDVSNWMHDNLKPGDEIRATGPSGDFTPDPDRPAKYLFLSGGSGVTPLMSMARTFDDLAEERDVVFVHAARTPADIVFRAELDLLARRSPGFRLAHVCEATAGEPSWPGYVGRLSLPMLRLIAPDLLEREVFVCGPSPFMAAVRGMLAEVAFDMARHHEESFNFEELTRSGAVATPPADAEPVPAAAIFRVEFARSGRTVECGAGTTILKAGLAAGLRLPSSCTRGLCGTCKAKLASGTVDMKHAGGIRQREIDQGMVLLCCSRPTSDVVVER
jgi:ferredoxin-NADP reductase